MGPGPHWSLSIWDQVLTEVWIHGTKYSLKSNYIEPGPHWSLNIWNQVLAEVWIYGTRSSLKFEYMEPGPRWSLNIWDQVLTEVWIYGTRSSLKSEYMGPCPHWSWHHGELTGQLGKCVQYEVNDFCLFRPGFRAPDISYSSRIVQVVHVLATSRLVGRSNKILTMPTPVQKATPVGGTVQIKQLIVVPDRVLCTRDFVL